MSNKQLITFFIECVVNTAVVQIYIRYNPDVLNYPYVALIGLLILCCMTALTHFVMQVTYLIIKYPILLHYKIMVQYKEIIFNANIQPSGVITNSTLSIPLPVNSMFNYKTKIKTIYPWFEREYNLDRYKVLTDLDKVKLL